MINTRFLVSCCHACMLTLMVCAQGALSGQVQSPLRSRVVLVPLDVRVLDENGDPVTGLTAADFTVYENGVRQEIAHFLPLSLAAGLEGREVRVRSDHPLAPEASSHRIFIFVFGRGNLNGPVKGMESLIDFVKHRIVSTDRVGLVAYLRESPPTTDHAAVVRFLERYRDAHEDIEERLLADVRFNLKGQPIFSEVTAARMRALFAVSGIPEFRDLPGADSTLYLRYHNAHHVRWAIQAARRLQGEKHVVVLSERGLPLERIHLRPEANTTVKLANEARVALSYINTAGLREQTVRKGKVYIPTRQLYRQLNEFYKPTDYRLLTEQTGGLATFYRNADVALDKLERASRSEYLIGYYPTVTSAPQIPRMVRVVINRKNVTAQYRHGYRLASSPNDEKEFEDAIVSDQLDAALEGLLDAKLQKLLRESRVGPNLKIATPPIAGANDSREILVSLSLDPTRLIFENADNSNEKAVLHIAVVADDVQGEELGEMRRSIEVSLAAKDMALVKKHWLAFDVKVALSGRPSRIRAAVYSYDSGSVWSAVAPVR